MKLVLDSNVIVAAFATRGLCGSLFEYCLESHEVINMPRYKRPGTIGNGESGEGQIYRIGGQGPSDIEEVLGHCYCGSKGYSAGG